LGITDVSALDKDKTQQLLKALHQPPMKCALKNGHFATDPNAVTAHME